MLLMTITKLIEKQLNRENGLIQENKIINKNRMKIWFKEKEIRDEIERGKQNYIRNIKEKQGAKSNQEKVV